MSELAYPGRSIPGCCTYLTICPVLFVLTGTVLFDTLFIRKVCQKEPSPFTQKEPSETTEKVPLFSLILVQVIDFLLCQRILALKTNLFVIFI